MHPVVYRHNTENANRPEGFSLLEMMMVVTVILIVVSIATPKGETVSGETVSGTLFRKVTIV